MTESGTTIEGGEMDDGGDAVLLGWSWPPAPGRRSNRATKGTALGIRNPEAGRQVVEHDHALAGVDKFVHHVAADITGAAGHQDCHALLLRLASAIF